MADTLVIPLSSGPKTTYVRNPKKPDSEKSILELFFDAQYDIETGVQPPICIRNGILIQHLGQRVRAPTTWETIQDGINKKSDVHRRAQEIETGDFSDDEEDDDELSSMQYPPSPNSSNPVQHTPPPPSPNTDEYSQSQSTFSGYNASSPRFNKPQPKGRARTARKRKGKVSLDEPVDGSITNSNFHKGSESTSSYTASNLTRNISNTSNNNNNNNNINNNIKYSKISDDSVSSINTNNNNTNNTNNNNTNSNGVDTTTIKHKNLSPRRRHGHTKRSDQSVGELWFKAQQELAEGRQPKICKHNGVRLENVRIHVKKYANHQKRSSRVSPQDFLNVYISKPRKSIAADDDEDDDLTDNDVELSTSKSNGDNSTNGTPTSKK